MENLRVEVIDWEYAAILAKKSPAERLKIIHDLEKTARVFLAAGARFRNPDWPDERISIEVANRISNGTN